MTTQTLAVLAVFLADPTAEWYGFDLADKTKLKSGTMYPLLARLEKAGWLTSRTEDVDPSVVGRPRRRLYGLTGEGELVARRELTSQLEIVSRPFLRAPVPREQPA
jgi:PadR family transcriptional regulator, regulatory protein PadR